MSQAVTNRVYLPDGTKLYFSDNVAGDARIYQLYQRFGNLKLEACYKDQEGAQSLDDLEPFWSGTIEEQYS